MKKPTAIPEPLRSAPFTLSAARDAGVRPRRLRLVDVQHISRGLYRSADWDFELAGAARALSAASPGAWISHVTAARLHGLILPPWLSDSEELHLSKPRSLPEVRRRGIIGHTVLAMPGEVCTADGIRISTMPRTWLDLATRLNLNDLVCIGDQLIRLPRPDFEARSKPYSTLHEMRALVARHPNLQGIVRARVALALMRVGADSGPETLLRLAMADAGLPEPELQLPLWPAAEISPTADLGYRRRRLAVQYDGGHHLLEGRVLSDRRRDKAFESAGWTVLILDREDLADQFQRATRKIRRALDTSALDAPSASGFAGPG